MPTPFGLDSRYLGKPRGSRSSGDLDTGGAFYVDVSELGLVTTSDQQRRGASSNGRALA